MLATLLLLALYYPVSAEEPALKSLLKKQGLAAPGAKGKAARSSPSAKAESKSTTVEVLLELVGKVSQPSTLIGLAERSSDIELDIEARLDGGEADGAVADSRLSLALTFTLTLTLARARAPTLALTLALTLTLTLALGTTTPAEATARSATSCGVRAP